jgi:peptidoglycan/xylan/chitin deacetylase (PgdA/CDA1 family)
MLRAAALAIVAVLTLGSCAEEADTGAPGQASTTAFSTVPSTARAHLLKSPNSRLRPGTPSPSDETDLPLPPPVPLTAALQSPRTPYATLRTDIRIHFDGALNLLVLRYFNIDPDVKGLLDWLDPETLRFQPDRLAFDTTYTVKVAVVGHSVWSWQFTTIKPITITVDDCASTGAELQNVLNVLARRHITPIMFPTGICQRKFAWFVPAMLAAGYRVCNHTYSHPRLTGLTDAQITNEIRGGVHAGCDLFRPPWGDWDGPGGRVDRIAAAQGYHVFMWDVDTFDWAGASTQEILDRIYGRGGVILLHFHGRNTVDALSKLDLQTG